MRFVNIVLTLVSIGLAAPVIVPRDDDFQPFNLTNTGLYDGLLEYVQYAGAADCIDTTAGVRVGYLNSSCTGEACVTAEDDVYVVNVVNSLSNAIILTDSGEEKIIIAFQGSMSFVDWVVDFSFEPVFYVPYAVTHGLDTESFDAILPAVHLGFETATDNFLENAVGVLKALKAIYPAYDVVVTGHSLGGALASLTGVELYLMGYNPAIIAYASPKVFNPTLVDWVDDVFNTDTYLSELEANTVNQINSNTFTRVTHYGDIVPCVPLATMGYWHAGADIYITKQDLPQSIDDVLVRGPFELEYELDTLGDIFDAVLANPGEYLSEGTLGWDHRDYFFVVSQCAL